MRDLSRDEVTALVFHRLGRDPAFREHFPAATPDGTRPIVVALLSDSLSRVVGEVVALGGSGNLVVPFLNGFFIVSMTPGEEADPCSELDPTCTVGLFLQRLQIDGPSTTYRLGEDSSGHEGGRAELVALAER